MVRGLMMVVIGIPPPFLNEDGGGWMAAGSKTGS